MLKKTILGMLVLGSCTACITQANSYIVNIGENMYNTTYSNYTYTYNIDSNLNFKTNDTYNTFFYTYDGGGYDGIRSRMLFWNDNKLYTYGAFQQDMIYGQGYISGFCMSNTTDYTEYCDNFHRNNYNTNIDTFYELGAIYDQVYFNTNVYMPILCFISNTEDIVSCIHQEISYQRNLQNTITPGNLISTIGTTPQQFVNEESKRENSPFIAPGPGTEGGPISCPNIKTDILMYGNKYNTGMCYTNGLYFSGFEAIQTGKLSIFEVFPSYEDYENRAKIYQNYCHAPYTQEYCKNAMSGNENAIQFFTYIENANKNSVFTAEAPKLYQYCHLQLNFTEEEKRSESVCTLTEEEYYATGININNGRPNPFEGVSEWIENNIETAVPKTGTVFDQFLEGDTRVVGITDRFGNFKELFHKFTGLFKYRETQEGIIPGYITAMIMIILLLAIFKK